MQAPTPEKTPVAVRSAPGGGSLSVVVPVYNEAANIDGLAAALTPVLEQLGLEWDVLFVDDGSLDGSLEMIRALSARDPRYRAISFSRNFGKETAMAAGLRYARGDGVLIMDADLQHPPQYIPEFIARWREGAKVVFGQRESRETDSWLRKKYSDLYHFVFRHLADTRLPRGIVDFVLLDRVAVDALNEMTERTRFTKGMFAWIGFRRGVVPFASHERAGGFSTFSFLKLARFGLDGIVSFSTLPLRVWSFFGVLMSTGAILYSLYFLIKTLVIGADVPGFPSLIVSISFFSGIQLISLGVLGEYLGRVFEEVKRRPMFLIAEEVGLAASKEETRGND